MRRSRIVLCTTTYLRAVSAKLPAGVSVCGHHYEVGTAPDWEMARSAAFPQLALWSATRISAIRSRTVCRHVCLEASSWAPSTVGTPSLRVRGQAFILVAWCRPALRSSLLRLLDSVRRLCCSTPLTGPLENAWCPSSGNTAQQHSRVRHRGDCSA